MARVREAGLGRTVGEAAILAVLLLLVWGGLALAQKSVFAIQSASLTQAGQQLQWTVQLDHSFSGTSLQENDRTLCLLIERRDSGSVVSQLCVAAARQARGPLRLRLAAVTQSSSGPAHTVAALVTRPTSSKLVASFTPASLGLGYRPFRWQVQSSLSPRVCAGHGAGASGQCTVRYPSRPALVRLHTPRLVGCAAAGRSLELGGSPARREIALTFDDGPWNDPPTLAFVHLLARYHAPATFFEIGDQIATYDRTGAVQRQMLADGDMIGDHTWTHPDMVALSPAQQTYQLKRTASAIRQATGFMPCLWRPPYGATNGRVQSLARSLGLLTIGWDIDPRDWSLPGVNSIESTVIKNARSGGIVELHFGGGPRSETLRALPTILDVLRHRGYRFVTVTQMLGLPMIYK